MPGLIARSETGNRQSPAPGSAAPKPRSTKRLPRRSQSSTEEGPDGGGGIGCAGPVTYPDPELVGWAADLRISRRNAPKNGRHNSLPAGDANASVVRRKNHAEPTMPISINTTFDHLALVHPRGAEKAAAGRQPKSGGVFAPKKSVNQARPARRAGPPPPSTTTRS